MQHDLELGYLGLEVDDPAALGDFLAVTVGLVAGEPIGEAGSTWRNDRRCHRVIVDPGPSNDVTFIGLEAVDAAAFERTVERLVANGRQVTYATKAAIEARRVARMAETITPWGIRLELVQGLDDATTEFSTPLVPGGFLTEGVGFGHVVFATTALEESHDFLTAGLGFSVSDWIETEIAAGVPLEVRFYHCNSRHHTIALAQPPFELPQKLHHVMFETNDRDDTGHAFDRAWISGAPIPNSLGRHDNDHMFSFYVTSPAGFAVEIGHGARTITADWADNRRYDLISAWGHQPLVRP